MKLSMKLVIFYIHWDNIKTADRMNYEVTQKSNFGSKLIQVKATHRYTAEKTPLQKQDSKRRFWLVDVAPESVSSMLEN